MVRFDENMVEVVLKQNMDNMLDMNGRESGPGQVISRILNE